VLAVPVVASSSRAEDLAEYFKNHYVSSSRSKTLETNLGGSGLPEIPDSIEFDLIINASSASLKGTAPDLEGVQLSATACAYDMMYGKTDTPFITWAKTRNLSTSNGFGMLIEQAADAFLVWEGVRPKTRMAYPRLRELLAQS